MLIKSGIQYTELPAIQEDWAQCAFSVPSSLQASLLEQFDSPQARVNRDTPARILRVPWISLHSSRRLQRKAFPVGVPHKQPQRLNASQIRAAQKSGLPLNWRAHTLALGPFKDDGSAGHCRLQRHMSHQTSMHHP